MDNKTYEPPKTKIYRFDENDRILTASNPEFAANALNLFLDDYNTTIE